tara:strand:+ start:181 stop:597 length:417 start_codon:yes stop_codon:yes gene_type:complete
MCVSYSKQYYQKNKEKWKEGYNKDKVSPTFNKEKYDKWVEKDLVGHLLRSSRNSAKIRKLEHSITRDDITIPTHCPLLGTELERSNVSIDRLDSTKGYVPGNIDVISIKANYLKGNSSIEDVLTFATNALKHYNKGEI